MDIWTQCYYRWLPVLEIKNGGNPQIDLFNRIILSSISKLQQDLQTRSYDDQAPAASTAAQSIDTLIQNRPMISSFFPFTRNTTNTNELTDILATSSELLTEGSIFDGLSVNQQGADWNDSLFIFPTAILEVANASHGKNIPEQILEEGMKRREIHIYTRNLESDKFKCNDTVQLVYMLTVDK